MPYRIIKGLSLARKLSSEIGFESLRQKLYDKPMYRAQEFQTIGCWRRVWLRFPQ